MTGKTYIIIPNYTGGWKNTIECLESVYRVDYPNTQIIVVDDGSRDDSLQHILQWVRGERGSPISPQQPIKHRPLPPDSRIKRPIVFHDCDFNQTGKEDQSALIVIRSTVNRGFAGANNLGLRFALEMDDFEYVWLLNNDTVVDEQALSHLVSRMRAKPGAGICGSTLLYYDCPDKVQTYGGVRYYRWAGLGKPVGANTQIRWDLSAEEIEKQMDYVYGSSMLVSKNFLRDIGLMNEEYFIYFEEIDWNMRAKGKYTLAFAPGSLVYHKAGATVGGGYQEGERNSLFSDYFYFKNMIRFTRKFSAWTLPGVYLRFSVIFLQKIFGRQWASAWLLVKTAFNFPVNAARLWEKK